MKSLLRVLLAAAVASAAMAGLASAQTGSARPDQESWARIRATADKAELQRFIARHPDSAYAELARVRLELIERSSQLRNLEREIARKNADERAEEARRLARERGERLQHERARAEEARLRSELAAVRARQERLTRARDEAERRREAQRARTEAQRVKAEAARDRAEQALKRLEEELARRNVDWTDPGRVRRPARPNPAAEPGNPGPARPVAPARRTSNTMVSWTRLDALPFG